MNIDPGTTVPIVLLVMAIAGREVLRALGWLPTSGLSDWTALAVIALLAVASAGSVVVHMRGGLTGAEPIDLVAAVQDVDWPAPTGTLPPPSYEELIPILAPIIEPLGYHVSRAQLFTNHLALYIAPLEEQTADQYAEAIVPLSQVFLPAIFDLWPDLASFDVCQEPVWEGGYDEEPPLVTIINLTRSQVESVDWDTVTLSDLINAARRDPTFRLGVDDAVAGSSVWVTAGGGDDLIDMPLAHDIARYDANGDLPDG